MLQQQGEASLNQQESNEIKNSVIPCSLETQQTWRTLIVEGIDEALFSLDNQGRFTYLNSQAAQVCGRSKESLLGKSLWEAFPTFKGSRFEKFYHQAMSDGKSNRLEGFFQCTQKWYDVRVYPIVQGLIVYFYDITNLKQVEQALQERTTELALVVANQMAVALENVNLNQKAQTVAVLEERQRIARELHDSVSQTLYGIGLHARVARTLLDQDPNQAIEPLEEVLNLTEVSLVEMRALIFELRPESLELEGLVTMLSNRAKALSARQGLKIENRLGEEPDVSLEIKEAVYRIAQEALHNIVKHANATQVELIMDLTQETLRLEVRDNGVGFNPDSSFAGHYGLKTMQERTERLGGHLLVESKLGQGTVIKTTIPIFKLVS